MYTCAPFWWGVESPTKFSKGGGLAKKRGGGAFKDGGEGGGGGSDIPMHTMSVKAGSNLHLPLTT